MARARRAITNSARVACVLVLILLGVAHASELGDRLATDDPHALDVAVTEISRAHGELADEVYAAGRVCEDKLQDPMRALAG